MSCYTQHFETKVTETPLSERLPYLALAVLSLAAAGATAILSFSQRNFFRPYFANLNPLLTVALVTVLGFVSLCFLQSRGWFEIYAARKTFRGVGVSAAIATLFAIEAVFADLIIRFPRDLNVLLPQSLLFYPAIGYVVEVCFHALPLVLLLAVLGPVFMKPNKNSLIWSCVFLASLIEPVVQMRIGFSQKLSSWAEAYVGLHLFAFNLLQLYVFRRYNFVSMYGFRLVYYLYWHILWGYFRLDWLFS
jgi:hypothetical protein